MVIRRSCDFTVIYN